jgi:hypothetical protein
LIAWKCQEVLSTHYAEKVTPEHQRNSLIPTHETTSIPEIVFRLSRKSGNAHPNRARDRTTNNSIKTPEYDERVFTPKKQKFFFLSNEAEGRRVIFTNDWFSDDKGISPTALRDILSLDQIYKEWDKILSYFTRQLNDAVFVRKACQINRLLILVLESIHNG